MAKDFPLGTSALDGMDPNVSQSSKNSSESSQSQPAGRPSRIMLPSWSKIVMGLLLLSLAVVSLLSIQQINLLQVQNGQLVSHSSNLDQQFSDLNRIVTLGASQVLANHQTISWTEDRLPLNFTCQCFKYSGYLRVNWNSTGSLSLRFAQFGLNLTTPRTLNGDFLVPVSSYRAFSAWFEMSGCNTVCSATYSAIYHY